MKETRDSQRTRILFALYPGDWLSPKDMPGHRRRAYSILKELTEHGIIESRIDDNGQTAWRMR